MLEIYAEGKKKDLDELLVKAKESLEKTVRAEVEEYTIETVERLYDTMQLTEKIGIKIGYVKQEENEYVEYEQVMKIKE